MNSTNETVAPDTSSTVTFSVDDDDDGDDRNNTWNINRWSSNGDKLILSCVVLQNVCISYHKSYWHRSGINIIEYRCCVHMPWTSVNCCNKEQVSVLYQRLKQHRYCGMVTISYAGGIQSCYKYDDMNGIEIVANSNPNLSRWLDARGKHFLRGHQAVLRAVQCTLAVGRKELLKRFPPVLAAVIIQYALLPGLLDFTRFILQNEIKKTETDVQTFEAIGRLLKDAGFALMDQPLFNLRDTK